jgi:serine/threonine protein kinase
MFDSLRCHRAHQVVECLGHEYNLRAYSAGPSDVWSLGVILVNLITGKLAWKMAATSDEAFNAYLYRPDFFKRVLPVSSQAESVLRQIFTINPSQRINISDLRRCIEDIDYFCISGDELRVAPHYVRALAGYYADHIPSPILAASQISDWCENQPASARLISPASAGSGCYLYPSPQISWLMEPGRRAATAPESPINACFDYDGPLVTSPMDDMEFDYDSSDDSEGPVTPDTHAYDPDGDVPELTLSSSSGGLLICQEAHDMPTPKPRLVLTIPNAEVILS